MYTMSCLDYENMNFMKLCIDLKMNGFNCNNIMLDFRSLLKV